MLRYRLRLLLVGWWFCLIGSWFTGDRRRARANLALVMGDLSWARRFRIESQSMLTIGRYYAELISLRRLVRVLEGARLHGPGVAALARATAEGRPCMLVTGHMANHLACIAALTVNGVDAGILYRRRRSAWLDRNFDRQMAAFGQPLFKIGLREEQGYHENMGALVRHIRRGGHVGTVLDQRVPSGLELPFFGRDAFTSLSLAALACRYDGVFIPSYAERLPGGVRYRFVLEEPIPTTNPVEMMTAFNARVEAWVRARPGQWFWNIRRWG